MLVLQVDVATGKVGVAEDAVDHPEQAFATLHDSLHMADLARIDRPDDLAFEQLCRRHDARQGGAQFVAHDGHELILEVRGTLEIGHGGGKGGGALGDPIFEFFVQLAQLLFHLLAHVVVKNRGEQQGSPSISTGSIK